MRGSRLTVWAIAGLVVFVCGCETPLDRAFGRSQREHVAQSIENPEAGLDDLEGPRTDSLSAENALGKHRRLESTLDEGEPPSVINIDVGG